MIDEGKILRQAVIDLNAKSVIELGTGESTKYLLKGLYRTGGKMVSIDIEPMTFNNGRVKIITLDDLEYEIEKENFIDIPCDMLFIDTSHTYKHTLAELRRYAPFVKKRIYLHDVNVHEEVERAIKEFIKESPEWEYENIEYEVTQRLLLMPKKGWGLGLLRRN